MDDELSRLLRRVEDADAPSGLTRRVRAELNRRGHVARPVRVREFPVGVGYTFGLVWKEDTFEPLVSERRPARLVPPNAVSVPSGPDGRLDGDPDSRVDSSEVEERVFPVGVGYSFAL